MAQNPEKQRKAQEEVDRVIGKDRLPNLSDKGTLPYVEALIREVARWHSVLPLSERVFSFLGLPVCLIHEVC